MILQLQGIWDYREPQNIGTLCSYIMLHHFYLLLVTRIKELREHPSHLTLRRDFKKGTVT